jgi:hypothetical protein
LRFNYRTLL